MIPSETFAYYTQLFVGDHDDIYSIELRPETNVSLYDATSRKAAPVIEHDLSVFSVQFLRKVFQKMHRRN
jgi:hypothetical protein